MPQLAVTRQGQPKGETNVVYGTVGDTKLLLQVQRQIGEQGIGLLRKKLDRFPAFPRYMQAAKHLDSPGFRNLFHSGSNNKAFDIHPPLSTFVGIFPGRVLCPGNNR